MIHRQGWPGPAEDFYLDEDHFSYKV
jgi:hypothetical protein